MVVATEDQIESEGRLIGVTFMIDDTTMYAHALDVLKGSMGFTVLDGRTLVLGNRAGQIMLRSVD